MMFRKLYWTSESVPHEGPSHVIGVYTSIPDLLRAGLRPEENDGLRLTLVKLDSSSEPLGAWTEEDAERLPEALAPFVATEEFTAESVLNLSHALGARKSLRSPARSSL